MRAPKAAAGAASVSLVALAMWSGSSPAVAATSTAAAPRAAAAASPFAPFAHCPVNNPAVTGCVVATITTGHFALGSFSLSLTQPLVIQLGLEPTKSGKLLGVVPDDGTPGLDSGVIPVPGGIPGLLGVPGFPSSGNAADVGVMPELDGTVKVDIQALLSRKGAGFALPVSAYVVNSLISSSCVIAPIPVTATDGTTHPPAGVAPLTGGLGKVTISPQGITTVKGLDIVTNTFPVPAATSCDALGVVPIDGIINAAAGLPAAPGKSDAVLKGTASFANAAQVRSALG